MRENRLVYLTYFGLFLLAPELPAAQETGAWNIIDAANYGRCRSRLTEFRAGLDRAPRFQILIYDCKWETLRIAFQCEAPPASPITRFANVYLGEVTIISRRPGETGRISSCTESGGKIDLVLSPVDDRERWRFSVPDHDRLAALIAHGTGPVKASRDTGSSSIVWPKQPERDGLQDYIVRCRRLLQNGFEQSSADKPE